MLQTEEILKKKLEKQTTLKHNGGLNPERHTYVRQRLKTLHYFMADPMFVV